MAKGRKSKGLGDDIEKITKATGIKKVVELFTPEGKDCGCDKRKEKLNKLFPRNKPNCLTEDQYKKWTSFKNRKNQNQVSPEEQNLIIQLLKDVLNMSVKPCATCSGSIWKGWIDKIDTIYNEYK